MARRQTRLLLTVAFVHEVGELALRAAPDRWAEAEELARELVRAGLKADLSETPPDADPLATVSGSGPSSAGMTIALPSRPDAAGARPHALVSIPYRHRVVVLGGLAGPGARGLGELQERGYRYDGRAPIPALRSPLQAAHASVTSRRPRQETALLRANAYRTEILIFQQENGFSAPVRPATARSPDGREAPR